mgnify:FL=1
MIYNKEEILLALKGLDLIKPIEKGFIEYSNGNSVVPPVGELIFNDPPGDVHIKYGYIKTDENYVIKIASGFPKNKLLGLSNSHGIMVMFDKNSGYLKCILHDEGYLTNVRTAIAGAICAKYLAPNQINKIGIIGTGIQARMQLEYLLSVTSCKDVSVLGRNEKNVERYIDEMGNIGFKVDSVKSSKDLCSNCNLIVTTTSANESLISKKDLRKGIHITAVGSDTPEKRELDPEILKIADVLVVDSISQCLERGETKYALDSNLISEDKLIELGKVIKSGEKSRKSENEITVADLTGVAVQDIMITNAVYEQLIK